MGKLEIEVPQSLLDETSRKKIKSLEQKNIRLETKVKKLEREKEDYKLKAKTIDNVLSFLEGQIGEWREEDWDCW